MYFSQVIVWNRTTKSTLNTTINSKTNYLAIATHSVNFYHGLFQLLKSLRVVMMSILMQKTDILEVTNIYER